MSQEKIKNYKKIKKPLKNLKIVPWTVNYQDIPWRFRFLKLSSSLSILGMTVFSGTVGGRGTATVLELRDT
jgi:hypothetical protein